MVDTRIAVLVAVAGGILLFSLGIPAWAALGVALTIGGWKYIRLVIRTVPRDLRYIKLLQRIGKTIGEHAVNRKTVSELFMETAGRYPNKTAIIFEEQKWTFRELDEFTNRVANHFRSLGLQKGDCVALFADNCPEFIGVWLGLGKIGAVSAFVNSSLRLKALIHCIRLVTPRAIVFHSSLSDAVQAVLPDLDPALSDKCYCICGESSIPQAKSLEAELEKASAQPPPPPPDKSFQDTVGYIFTSGTTGLPKACTVNSRRFFAAPCGINHLCNLQPEDIIYLTLPLYHATGGSLAVGQMLYWGCTLVLKRKFSAKSFWNDCVEHRCTVIFYIGEQCRYILAQPESPLDRQHCVRIAVGNGLRPQIWPAFQKRFKIPVITETYGATEGNFGLVNFTGRVGACGVLSVFLPSMNVACLIKVDPETGNHPRDSNGFCIKAGIDEPGEIVAVSGQNNPQKYDGYHCDITATQKKVIHNVFKPGDAYFLSGDILRMDEEGFLYFCDRMGDTFRWKGENVSTTEVEAVISKILELRDVVVYGVEIPGMEGRAGMAAIVDSDDEKALNLDNLAQQLYLSLPSYAVPVFIRVIKSADIHITGNYKFKKAGLRNEGFSQEQVSDPLFILDPGQKAYSPFTPEMHQQLVSGAMRV